jgi:N-acetyl-alpha-D-glucosaminyl L-malate synthase BshA
MHVSNFRPVKRVDVVFEVFRRLCERREARLVLVGDGPDRLPLARAVGQSRFADDVQFFNERPDLASWLSMADAFLLPSAQESFGLAALEAMACEVPVVVSRVGGLPEVVEDGVTGYLCDPDDVDAMVDRLDELCGDPKRRADIGRAAADVVRTRFCAGVIVPQYEAVYDDVLKQTTSGVVSG